MRHPALPPKATIDRLNDQMRRGGFDPETVAALNDLSFRGEFQGVKVFVSRRWGYHVPVSGDPPMFHEVLPDE